MNVYLVTALKRPKALENAVSVAYPGDFLKISEEAWLVSGIGTAEEVTIKLAMPIAGRQPINPDEQHSAIVSLITDYYGFGPMPMWAWIAERQGRDG